MKSLLDFLVVLAQFSLALTVSRLAERAILKAGKLFYQNVVLWVWAVISMRG